MTAEFSTRLTRLMEEAVAYSSEQVRNGGIPFTAFVVGRNGAILGRGVNRVREHHDPTAHAEVEAIRDACRTHDPLIFTVLSFWLQANHARCAT